MNKPGADFRTRTINIPGVISELQNNLKVRLEETIKDYRNSDDLLGYMQQDLEVYKGSLELMYNIGFIDKELWDTETENGYMIYVDMAKTA